MTELSARARAIEFYPKPGSIRDPAVVAMLEARAELFARMSHNYFKAKKPVAKRGER